MKSAFYLAALCICVAPSVQAQTYYESYPQASNAGNVAAVTTLEEELRRLTGRVEELENRLRRVERNAPDNKAVPVAGIATVPVQPMRPVSITPTNSNNAPVRNLGNTAREDSTPFGSATAPEDALSPREMYDQGLNALKRDDYSTSRALLGRFVDTNPKHRLLGNAHYWLGESFYAQNDYKQAAQHFLKGYQSAKNGIKAPDNLLKLAMSLHALGKTAEACTSLSKMESAFEEQDRPVAMRKANERRNAWNCET